jgi:hypothetical protein
MSNSYQGLATYKLRLKKAGANEDDLLMSTLVAASRAVDSWCNRKFYTLLETRVLDGPLTPRLPASQAALPSPDWGALALANYCSLFQIPECVALSLLKVDADGDNTFETTLAEGTDFELRSTPHTPYGTPKSWLRLLPSSSKFLPPWPASIQATGEWGHGDGLLPLPRRTANSTATLTDGATTTCTLSNSGGLVERGHTLRVESEQLYVLTTPVVAAGSATCTVVRAMNGTTAAAHAAIACYLATYPEGVTIETMNIAAELRNNPEQLSQIRQGDFFFQIGNVGERMIRFLGPHRTPVMG